MSDPLSFEELQELEKLLLILEFAQPDSPTPLMPPEPPAPAETNEKSAKPRKFNSAAIEPARDFIDRLCGEGSDKPSGKSLTKWSWMV